MIWFTSDWHLGHENILEFSKRPFATIDDHDKGLIANYNSLVSADDTVFFLGDVSFHPFNFARHCFSHLVGKRILVRGNHDGLSREQYEKLGFSLVCEEMVLKLFGKRIRLSHYPRLPLPDEKDTDRHPLKYRLRRHEMDGKWLLHGHTHDEDKIIPKRMAVHVGVDAWNYRPVSLSQIESLIAKAEKDDANLLLRNIEDILQQQED